MQKYGILNLPNLVNFLVEKQVKSAVKQCFSAVKPNVVYSSNELLFATNKDVQFVHIACVTEKQRGLSIFMPL